MSKFLQKPPYSDRAKENQWLGIIFQTHDLICGCDTPHGHLTHLLNSQQCRHFKDTVTTTETGGTGDEEELGIDAGDLEKLFEAANDVTEG